MYHFKMGHKTVPQDFLKNSVKIFTINCTIKTDMQNPVQDQTCYHYPQGRVGQAGASHPPAHLSQLLPEAASPPQTV